MSAILLWFMLKMFETDDMLVFGLDEAIQRQRADKIRAKGIYRDSIRSSKEHFVKARGLRWVCLMWLITIPFALRA